MLTNILSMIGVGFLCALLVNCVNKKHIKYIGHYRLLLLSGISLATMNFFLSSSVPSIVQVVPLTLLYAAPFFYFFLVDYASKPENPNRFYFMLLISLGFASLQALTYMFFDYHRHSTLTEISLLEFTFNRIPAIAGLLVAMYALTISCKLSFYDSRKDKQDRDFNSTLALAVMPIIGTTIVYQFGTIIFGHRALPSPESMDFFSVTLVMSSAFMLHLRFNNNWTDIFYTDVSQLNPAMPGVPDGIGNEILNGTSAPEEADPKSCQDANTFVKQFIDDKAYQNPRLSMHELSEKMAIPEYKLRQYIINNLGFKNFNHMVNYYRIQFLKDLITSSENEGTPIKTLAYYSGFETPETCCRVFKSLEGITPSQYKKQIKNET